jgi:DNA-binding CsgD family transcriptional regulator/PAS domain-containing protein
MAGVPQDLLLDLYGGVTEPTRWARVLDRVCDDLSARSAIVQRIHPGETGALATRWLARDSYSEENGALHDSVVADELNPRMRYDGPPPMYGPGQVVRDSDIPQMAGMAGRRFREALRSVGLGEYLKVDDRRGFGPGEERYVAELTGHLRQAMVLGDVIETERSRGSALGAVVDRMRFGVLTCDASGRVSWMSRRARELLSTRRMLAVRDGRISCASERDAALLGRMLAAGLRGAAAAEALGWETLGVGTADALHGMAVPLRGDGPAGGADDPDAGRIALFINAPGAAPPLDTEAIGRLLGLTPAEARLAAGLCGGLSVKEYARTRGLAEGTVRFQLKQALAKTGSARQSDLVRQVCSSLAAEIAPA